MIRALIAYAVFLSVGFAAMLYFALGHTDNSRSCYQFTREVKIVQACQAANSCVFSPADLRRVDELQESCQRLGK